MMDKEVTRELVSGAIAFICGLLMLYLMNKI